MKFTKTAFRKAFKEANQMLVWKLTAIKVGHTPTKTEVSNLIDTIVNPKSQRAYNDAWNLVHTSYPSGLEQQEGETKEEWENRIFGEDTDD